jgi:hypothetical protein
MFKARSGARDNQDSCVLYILMIIPGFQQHAFHLTVLVKVGSLNKASIIMKANSPVTDYLKTEYVF